MIETLSRSQVRQLSRILRAAGWKLPKIGWQIDVPREGAREFVSEASRVPRSVAHDARGYYFVGWEHVTGEDAFGFALPNPGPEPVKGKP